MLGLAEYVAASRGLLTHAQNAEADVAQNRAAADEIYTKYFNQYQSVLETTMWQVAENAVDHYASLVGIESDPDLIQTIVNKQWTQPYYGSSLGTKLSLAYQNQNNILYRTRSVGERGIDGVLTQSVPFGAAYHTQKRLMLGTLVKIENDAARASATQADIPLIRWTLSHQHPKPDICDDLASNVDKGVVEFLEQRNLKVDPKGVYFAEDLPEPPHPNCQCEFALITEEGKEHQGPLRRTFHALTSLLRRLRST